VIYGDGQAIYGDKKNNRLHKLNNNRVGPLKRPTSENMPEAQKAQEPITYIHVFTRELGYGAPHPPTLTAATLSHTPFNSWMDASLLSLTGGVWPLLCTRGAALTANPTSAAPPTMTHRHGLHRWWISEGGHTRAPFGGGGCVGTCLGMAHV
jgi:hypothetical protein